MKKRNFIFCFLLLMLTSLLVSKNLYAQTEEDKAISEQRFNAIYTSVPSMQINPSARAGGMADIGTSSTPDLYSQYFNASKYAFLSSRAGVGISYTPWLAKLVRDIKLMEMVGYYKIGRDENQALSASVRYFSLGSVPQFDDMARSLGDAHPNEFAVDFGYSILLTPDYSMGVTLRYIRADQNLATGDSQAGNAFAADISGFLTKYFFIGQSEALLTFGYNIKNIGTKISYGGDRSMFLPTQLRLGSGFLYPFDDYNALSFNVEVDKLLVPTPPINDQKDIEKYNKEREAYEKMNPIVGIFKSFADAPGGFKEELQEVNLALGVEYSYNNMFFVRGGYHYQSPYKGNLQFFTVGAGFKMNVFSIDASYLISAVPSNPLDQTLRFTIGFDLDGIRGLLK